MTSQTRQGEEELMDRQITANFAMSPATEHLDILPRQERRRAPRVSIGVTTGVAQIEQRQGHGGKQSDGRLKPLDVCELQVLDSAACLERLVIFFNDPSPLVPTRHAPS